MESKERDIRGIKEPSCSCREVYRQLFDSSILMSCIRNSDNRRILDFAGGSGWLAEFLNQARFDVATFDILPLVQEVFSVRIRPENTVRMHGTQLDAVFRFS